MSLINVFQLQQMRPHVGYRFNCRIWPYGSNSDELAGTDFITFTVKKVTQPVFKIGTDNRKHFGNTQYVIPVMDFGQTELSITFEETDEMEIYKFLINMQIGQEAYNFTAKPLMNIEITQFDETMLNELDKKLYVGYMKSYDTPNFNNNGYGQPVDVTATFYIEYVYNSTEEIQKLEYNENGSRTREKEPLNDFANEETASKNWYQKAEMRQREWQKRNPTGTETPRSKITNKVPPNMDNVIVNELTKIDQRSSALAQQYFGVTTANGVDAETINTMERMAVTDEQKAAIYQMKVNVAAKDELTALQAMPEASRNILENTKDFDVSSKETLQAYAKILSENPNVQLTYAELRGVHLKNAERMQTAMAEFKDKLSKNGITTKTTEYNNPMKHSTGLGTSSGSHVLGQKIDLNFTRADGTKITTKNATAEERKLLKEIADQSGLQINWEYDGSEKSLWGDVALKTVTTVDKQGKVYDDVNLTTWSPDRAYNTKTGAKDVFELDKKSE